MGSGYGDSVTQAGPLAGWLAWKVYLQDGHEESMFGKGRGCSLRSCSSLTEYSATHYNWVILLHVWESNKPVMK